jgi:hypothetical protein
MYELTEDQIEDLIDYFVLSTTATSNEEILALLAGDEPLLAMLRTVKEEQS